MRFWIFTFLSLAILFVAAFSSQSLANDGTPDPRDSGITIGFDNFLAPPFNRWGLQHVREVVPTRAVPPSSGTVPFPEKHRDIGELTVRFASGKTRSVADWLTEAYTDGFLVLHQGAIVYEQYFNGQNSATPHLMFSVTKSVTGTLMLMLVEKGRIKTNITVGSLVPELAESVFADATVQHMLDMTNSIDYLEDYFNPEADITRFLMSMGPQGEGLHANLQDLKRPHPKFKHGEAFHYVTPDPEVLAWIIRKTTGQNLADTLHQMIWSKLGTEHEAYYWLDYHGIEMAGGGLSMTLKDAGRFGQMILDDGKFGGTQVIPAAVAKRIKTPGNAATMKKFYDDPWYGEVALSYHDQWWDYTDAVAALGVHGQFIYINEKAGVVIIKQSSDPEAEAERIDDETPQVMQTIATHLRAGNGMTSQ